MENILSADIGVVPVQHVHRPLRANLEAEPNPLRVVGHHEVVAVMRRETRSLPDQHVGEHPVLVDVGHEDPPVLRCGKGIGLIHARPAVSGPMAMIGNGLDVAVHVRVEVLPPLALVDPAGNDMPEVRDHTGADEQLPLCVVIDAPGIAEPVGHHLEDVLRRVVAPHAAIDVDSFPLEEILGKGFLVPVQPPFALRLPDFGRGRVALEAVQPAVGAPVQAVQRLVPVADPPAGQANLDIGDVGLVVTVAIRDEEQVRRGAHEHAVKADRQGGRKGDSLHEHLPAVGNAVAVRVLENDDPAGPGVGEPLLAVFVVVVLSHPQAPAIVPAEGHRLCDHRLTRPGVDREPVDQRHLRGGRVRRQEGGLTPFLLRDPPEHRGGIGGLVLRELLPGSGHGHV